MLLRAVQLFPLQRWQRFFAPGAEKALDGGRRIFHLVIAANVGGDNGEAAFKNSPSNF